MGNARDFFSRDAQGRRAEYTPIGSSKVINGVKGSIIKKIGDTNTHTNLPFYANSSNVYFRKNAEGVCQARVYIGQKLYLDFDWSHDHRNKSDGRTFAKGTVHVQIWQENKDGSFSRLSNSARKMNNTEMKTYGKLIKAFCPNVKLR